MAKPVVSIMMGSSSDWETLKHSSATLQHLGIPHEQSVVSAHRSPQRMIACAEEAQARGLQILIAGAGGAAHLPGMLAAVTPIPVIGVPIESHPLKGIDSLLSIVQMPAGIPVLTMSIGKAGAVNAALAAAAILGLQNPSIAEQLKHYREAQTKKSQQSELPT